MNKLSGLCGIVVIFNLLSKYALCQNQLQPELVKILENCHTNSTTFDPCIKTAFNELRVFFKTG